MAYLYNGHFYQLTSGAMSWIDAEAEAQAAGGHLATVNDAAENQWLVSTFTNSSRYIWIGYTDSETEGIWSWVDGSNSSYTNWNYGEPNNGLGGWEEDYAHLYQNGFWNDLANTWPDWNAHGIIEIFSKTFDGDANKNLLTGSSISDKICGYEDSDTLIGWAGNDTLDGGTGADSMYGGQGDDIFYVDNAFDNVVESSTATTGGNDTIISSLNWTLKKYQENLTLTGLDNLKGTGNSLNNVLTGNDGQNTLVSYAGDDILSGGAGNDVLIGGLGSDKMAGGLGADKFIFQTAEETPNGIGSDTILDFESGSDKISLAKIDADTSKLFNNAFSFIGEAAFSAGAASAQVRFSYDSATGVGTIFGSTNSDVSPEFAIKLTGVSSLSASDFVL